LKNVHFLVVVVIMIIIIIIIISFRLAHGLTALYNTLDLILTAQPYDVATSAF